MDKIQCFNSLVTKYEAYLKKLYYLIHDEEVEGQGGKSASLVDSIHAFSCLWNLKYGHTEEARKYSQYLQMLRDWRNDSSHSAPTTSEQEMDAAIQIVVAMYLYVTGYSITDLEMVGFGMNEDTKPLRKLERVEDDLNVRNLLYQRIQMDANVGDGDLRREVIELYGERYPDMSPNDWRHIIEEYTPMVKEAARPKATDSHTNQYGMAAEPMEEKNTPK